MKKEDLAKTLTFSNLHDWIGINRLLLQILGKSYEGVYQDNEFWFGSDYPAAGR